MTVYTGTLTILGLYFVYKKFPSIKSELRHTKYVVTKKGANLESLIQTPNIGDFEIKILENSKGEYDLDEINYENPLITKLPIYKNNSLITPATSKSPFTYKLSAKNKNIILSTHVKHKLINGSGRVSIGPDKSGRYQVNRITLYNKHRKRIFSYSPPIKKPKPTVSKLSPIAAPSSSGNSSP